MRAGWVPPPLQRVKKARVRNVQTYVAHAHPQNLAVASENSKSQGKSHKEAGRSSMLQWVRSKMHLATRRRNKMLNTAEVRVTRRG